VAFPREWRPTGGARGAGRATFTDATCRLTWRSSCGTTCERWGSRRSGLSSSRPPRTGCGCGAMTFEARSRTISLANGRMEALDRRPYWSPVQPDDKRLPASGPYLRGIESRRAGTLDEAHPWLAPPPKGGQPGGQDKTVGAVAKRLGNGLQNHHTWVRIPSAPRSKTKPETKPRRRAGG
jgi:hypothetical protein